MGLSEAHLVQVRTWNLLVGLLALVLLLGAALLRPETQTHTCHTHEVSHTHTDTHTNRHTLHQSYL